MNVKQDETKETVSMSKADMELLLNKIDELERKLKQVTEMNRLLIEKQSNNGSV